MNNTTTVVKIILNQLKGLGACKEQLKLFEDTFGEEVSFKTKAQAVKVAVKMVNKFEFRWASDNLLGGAYRKAYEETIAPLYEAYEEALAKEFAKCYFDQEQNRITLKGELQ